MSRWANWSGRLTSRPQTLHFARSEADIQALVTGLGPNRSLRAVGAAHSHAPLVANDDVILDLQALSGLVSVDRSEQTAWVGAGTRIFALGPALHTHHLALTNQGDIDQQTIAGATATGTHGTGIYLKNLTAAVVGARIVLADGSVQVWDEFNDAALWRASRLHLGAFGVVTQLKLQLREAYRLSESSTTLNLDETLNRFPDAAANHRHAEYFWQPTTDEANLKTIDVTNAVAEYPLRPEGQRTAWSYEVLPNHRPHKHTEMEYSVPAEHGTACMRDIAEQLRKRFTDVRWPVEYRTLARDDVWLSTAYERDTVTISVHEDVREDEREYYQACEEIFLHYDGRPHWGKVHYLSGQTLAERHPAWDDWWRVRDSLDPGGLFLNAYLKELR